MGFFDGFFPFLGFDIFLFSLWEFFFPFFLFGDESVFSLFSTRKIILHRENMHAQRVEANGAQKIHS